MTEPADLRTYVRDLPLAEVLRCLDIAMLANDVRGVVGETLSESVAYWLGRAFARIMRDEGVERVVIGHDMRPSSAPFAQAAAEGVADSGGHATIIGLASTDMLYYASGTLDSAGMMITASHNPAKYNGIKFCRPAAVPVARGSGLEQVPARITAAWDAPVDRRSDPDHRDLLADYAAFLRTMSRLDLVGPIRVVVDAGNGMAGHTVGAVFDGSAVEIIPMFFELDGTFPNHEANPLDPRTLVQLQQRVIDEGADLGLAFDGDADRCFMVDELGRLIDPSAMTAVIAAKILSTEPGARIIYSATVSRQVPEVIEACGGVPVRSKVGHAYIKRLMAETGAAFGGEHSGHFYFRDFWRADSGLLAALYTLNLFADAPAGTRMSQLIAPYARYARSGEVNFTVLDPKAEIAGLRERWSTRPGVTIDELDGLSVSGDTWTFNVRGSNTEPLLRLNVEADTGAAMVALRDEVAASIRSVPRRG